ncbi:reverse transcriptase domain-containing protein, partial [Salmonella enterica]|uniref:reverse transcriptase domain-containing protein n=1 Tax=Salmonella enterica TaxID=28901 RepID=UPI003C6DC1A7
MWERVINNRLVELVKVTVNQCGFVSGKSTIDAIHTVRLLMERYRDMKTDLHIVFIDLEKAFDRVPRKLIWQALRDHNVP